MSTFRHTWLVFDRNIGTCYQLCFVVMCSFGVSLITKGCILYENRGVGQG